MKLNSQFVFWISNSIFYSYLFLYFREYRMSASKWVLFSSSNTDLSLVYSVLYFVELINYFFLVSIHIKSQQCRCVYTTQALILNSREICFWGLFLCAFFLDLMAPNVCMSCQSCFSFGSFDKKIWIWWIWDIFGEFSRLYLQMEKIRENISKIDQKIWKCA